MLRVGVESIARGRSWRRNPSIRAVIRVVGHWWGVVGWFFGAIVGGGMRDGESSLREKPGLLRFWWRGLSCAVGARRVMADAPASGGVFDRALPGDHAVAERLVTRGM